MYFLQAPYIRYSSQSGDYLENCDIERELVNPDNIVKTRLKRESSSKIGDYYFDANFTEIPYAEYDDLTDFEREQLAIYGDQEEDLPEYDYSQFDNYNMETGYEPPPNEPTDIEEFPTNERVEEEEEEEDKIENMTNERKSETEEYQVPAGPGQIQIVCKVNLKPRESADLTVRARLYSKTLIENYADVAQFEIPSRAEISPDESLTFLGSNASNVLTRVSALDPIFAQSKIIVFICFHIQ